MNQIDNRAFIEAVRRSRLEGIDPLAAAPPLEQSLDLQWAYWWPVILEEVELGRRAKIRARQRRSERIAVFFCLSCVAVIFLVGLLAMFTYWAQPPENGWSDKAGNIKLLDPERVRPRKYERRMVPYT